MIKLFINFYMICIQQAAYLLIPESQKQITHLKIGKLLLENSKKRQDNYDIQENIFNIVNQLNYGIDLINNIKEKEENCKIKFNCW